MWILLLAASTIVAGFAGLDRWLYESLALRLNTPTPGDSDFYHVTLPLWDAIRLFPHAVGGAIAFAAIALLRPHGWRRAGVALFVVAIVAGAATILQDAVGRLRPDHANSAWAFAPPLSAVVRRQPVSFPSGEVVTAFTLAYVLRRQFRKLRHCFDAAAASVALARCLFGMHYLSDVVAGALLGRFLARTGWLIALRFVRDARRRAASAGPQRCIAASAARHVPKRPARSGCTRGLENDAFVINRACAARSRET